MALVVFLRGVNVGGRKAFQPSALAKELAEFDVVNIGAAGTFVIRKVIKADAARAEILGRLPFAAEMMICSSREVTTLTFPIVPSGEEVTRYVSVLARRPRNVPPLPICQPAGREWQVQVVGVTGRFALSVHRRMGRTLVYPNEVVEKRLGISATTRNWNTITSICDILRGL